MKFHVGQRVRVNCPDSLVHGEVTTITRLNVVAREFSDDCEWPNYDITYIGHEVDIEDHPEEIEASGQRLCVFEERELVPLDGDDNIVSNWSTVPACVRELFEAAS
jgi:hypothetical protein